MPVKSLTLPPAGITLDRVEGQAPATRPHVGPGEWDNPPVTE